MIKIFLILGFLFVPTLAHSEGLEATVLKVIDGDTIKVRIKIWLNQTLETNVRLRGIDAPEIQQAKCQEERQKGIAAKNFLRQQAGKTLTIQNHQQGKYANTIIADLYTPNLTNLAQLMLKKTHARPYGGGTRGGWCGSG